MPPHCERLHAALEHSSKDVCSINICGGSSNSVDNLIQRLRTSMRAFEDAQLIAYSIVAYYVVHTMDSSEAADDARTFLASDEAISSNELINLIFIATYAPGEVKAVLLATPREVADNWLFIVKRPSAGLVLFHGNYPEPHLVVADQSASDLASGVFCFSSPRSFYTWGSEMNVKVVIKDFIVRQYVRLPLRFWYYELEMFVARQAKVTI